MQTWNGPLQKIDDYRWRIPKSYKPGMRVDGVIYAVRQRLTDGSIGGSIRLMLRKASA